MQIPLFSNNDLSLDQLSLLSREELVQIALTQQKENNSLRALNEELSQKIMFLEDKYVLVKNKIFAKSSEKSSAAPTNAPKKEKKTKIQLPSQRYQNAPLIEREVTLQELPDCRCCGSQMEDSGMTEDSEFLTAIPKRFFVVRQKRHKYRCGKCHGDIQTAPAPPRIKEGSVYSDEMIVDVALTKYCDLIPIERYASMAGREGLKDLPPQSLIESTHYLAEFVKGAYDRLKAEILQSKVLHADETPHRMLEGDKKSNWFLWGFSNSRTSYFECHNTRSGDVASRLMTPSACLYLVSDVFSGYKKAVREANVVRHSQGQLPITCSYCNAHSRRRFREARDRFPQEAEFFIEQYAAIYRLEEQSREKPPDEVLRIRSKMVPLFEGMRTHSLKARDGYSTKSSLGRAMSYFLENYEAFTLFTQNPELPIDNNPQERLLRNPVIGRKTWYGTHSKRGAETATILFSLVESCKLNKLNPRKFFRNLIQDLHQGKSPYTPKELTDSSQ